MLGTMPELPEVERGRRVALKVARGRRIVEARCADDPIVFDRVSPARIRRALVGRRVRDVKRHGKHLWFELDHRPWPCLHFGMTGGFHTAPGGPRVKLESTAKKPDHAWPPRFTKLHLVFGGRVKDPQGLDFVDLSKIDLVGLYDSYAAAEDAWRGAAQRTVDDAHMSYFIVHLHRLLDPEHGAWESA